MRLKGKTAIVTGGSRGIGKAISMEFASQGANVIVNYATQADDAYPGSGQKVVDAILSKGGEADLFEANVSDKSAVDKMVSYCFEKYGRLDIMVANAGICPFKEFINIDEKLLDRVLGVNLKGAFFCAQAAVEKMIKNKIPGRVIFISSVSAIFGGELQAHYCASKGGVNQLMKSVAIACGKDGITSNAVLPGTVITDINRRQLEQENPGLKKYFIERTPLKRLAEAGDIAKAALFFASDDAACVSGTALIVDGGMSINLQ